MSRFLSNKFLQYRSWQGQSRTIDQDLFCVSCGYNVRGLVYGRNCPECGTQIKRSGATIKDPLIAGDWHERQSLRTGLALVSTSLFVVAIARLGLMIVLFATLPVIIGRMYLVLGVIVSLAWIVGVWMVTPPRFDEIYHRIRWVRRVARWSAPLLVPGYVAWWIAITVAAGTNTEDLWRDWSILLRGSAGIGALLLAAYLVRLASDAELEDAAKRMYYAIWMLPIPSLLLIVLPSQFIWIALILYAIPLLIWVWYMIAYARGAFDMFNHISWAMRIAADYPHRLNRMSETRSELESKARKVIRPVTPTTPNDLPIK